MVRDLFSGKGKKSGTVLKAATKKDEECIKIDELMTSEQEDEEDYGYQFLQKIWESQNIYLFEIPAIIILTEFLFDKYKNRVFAIRLPFYLLALLVFFVTVYFHEARYSTLETKHDSETLNQIKSSIDEIAKENADTITLVLGILNAICTLYEFMKIMF